jgi:hypothetical protein
MLRSKGWRRHTISGSSELLLGEVGETLLVEDILEVLKSESVVEDLSIGDLLGLCVDNLTLGDLIGGSSRNGGHENGKC